MSAVSTIAEKACITFRESMGKIVDPSSGTWGSKEPGLQLLPCVVYNLLGHTLPNLSGSGQKLSHVCYWPTNTNYCLYAMFLYVQYSLRDRGRLNANVTALRVRVLVFKPHGMPDGFMSKKQRRMV